MLTEVRQNYESDWAAITAVAQKLGIGTAETLRKWVRQAQVDAGQRAGVSTDESAELKRLRRENAELRRANEILKSAAAFFAETAWARFCVTRLPICQTHWMPIRSSSPILV
jgi:transposase